MIQYVKARLYNKANGTFVSNGIFIKRGSIADPTRATFLFLHKRENLSFPGETEGSAIRIRNVKFTCESGALCASDVCSAMSVDSFETMLIGLRLDTNEAWSPYRVILGDEIVTAGESEVTVNYDQFFAEETRESVSATGVLIKSGYTQDETYSGFGSYHSNQTRHNFNRPISNDKPYRIGVELEVYARSQQAFQKITGACTNWFQCERDGSLSERVYRYTDSEGKVRYKPSDMGEANLGIEIKTIPLRPTDATSTDFWSEPMEKLAGLAVTKSFSSTGLHVHISKEILGADEAERQKNLSKLIWFYTYFVEDDPDAHRKNVVICGREHGYSVIEGGAKTDLGDFAKLSPGILAEVMKCDAAYGLIADGIKTKCEEQRGDINLKRWNSYGTIEFRKGKGIISRTRLAAICTWWEQMCLYCKETHQRNLSFGDFFARVMQFPAVAHFFQSDEEC